jgi:hydrogenase-4 component B
MQVLLSAIGILVLSGLAALLAGGRRLSTAIGATGAVAGCVLGLVPAARTVLGAPTETFRATWQMPLGSFYVKLDPLSAFFLLPILGLSALAAVYGARYHLIHGAKPLGGHWFFYNLLVAGMAMTVVSANGLLFLVAWEVMSLASFFLVTFEDESKEVREAGWTYLVATHLGTAFLIAMFVILGTRAGTLDFDSLAAGGLAPGLAGMFFIFAVVGFGTKAGFMPFHVWLPEAHPVAPSHVSAVMSGVMIKVGIYGLVRMLLILGTPPAWWGWTLVAIGASSGVLGVLFALAQHDLKKLLAYHSVENIGIITLGLGVGLLGLAYDSRALVVLGFAGGLLHVVNHATFKGLLFLSAGAVLTSTHTRDMDHLGGLLKRMPGTGMAFLIGAVAISGLPPLNGFVSEFLIYFGALRGIQTLSAGQVVPAIAVIAALALIGGLAAACFAKAFGIVFLGEPRSEHAAHVTEVPLMMRAPMAVLAALCIIIGLAGPYVPVVLSGVVGQLAGISAHNTENVFGPATAALLVVVTAAAAFLVLLAGLALLRKDLLKGREVTETGTWDCGSAAPTARMQYTSSSFAQPLAELFGMLLRTRRRLAPPEGLFPRNAAMSSETPDVCREAFYAPVFRQFARALGRLQWLQQGSVHVYVLYIVLTLIALLIWKLG